MIPKPANVKLQYLILLLFFGLMVLLAFSFRAGFDSFFLPVALIILFFMIISEFYLYEIGWKKELEDDIKHSPQKYGRKQIESIKKKTKLFLLIFFIAFVFQSAILPKLIEFRWDNDLWFMGLFPIIPNMLLSIPIIYYYYKGRHLEEILRMRNTDS